MGGGWRASGGYPGDEILYVSAPEIQSMFRVRFRATIFLCSATLLKGVLALEVEKVKRYVTGNDSYRPQHDDRTSAVEE